MTLKGLLVDDDLFQLCFLALVLLPLLFAVRHIANARRLAKTEMMRRAFELERHARQCGKPAQHQRAAVVAHHCILSFLEEILETCVYGSRPAPMPRHELHAYKQKLQKASKVAEQRDIKSLRVCPKDEMLSSAAGGLRGSTMRGDAEGTLSFFNTSPELYQQWDNLLACVSCMLTMRVSSRLQDIHKFVEYIVEVVRSLEPFLVFASRHCSA